MFDIGDQQFLMLLLMMETERDSKSEIRPLLICYAVDQQRHSFIDMMSITIDFLECRARKETALRAWMHGTRALIIRIEQDGKPVVEFVIISQIYLQEKGFEEPADMGKVPFRWTDVGHGLHAAVFRRQRRAYFLAHTPYGAVVRQQGLSLRRTRFIPQDSIR